jgi:hypothetical protein
MVGVAAGEPVGLLHATSRFVALGYDFSIETTDPRLCAYLDRMLGSFAREGAARNRYSFLDFGPRVDERYRLYFNGGCQLRAGDGASPMDHLLWHINSEAVNRSVHLLLHASAAELGGTAVVLPAPSGSGKSTLVAALIRAGFRYLTDEAVALNSVTGNVDPYPKPLYLDGGSKGLFPELRPELDPGVEQYATTDWIVDVRSIGPDVLAPPAPVAFVVGPAYRAGAETRLVPLRPAETAMLMIENAFNLRSHGRAGLDLLAAIARQAPGFRLEIGNLEAACSLIAELMIRCS